MEARHGKNTKPNGAFIVPLQDGRSLEEPLGTSESADCIMALMTVFFWGDSFEKKIQTPRIKRHGEVHKIIKRRWYSKYVSIQLASWHFAKYKRQSKSLEFGWSHWGFLKQQNLLRLFYETCGLTLGDFRFFFYVNASQKSSRQILDLLTPVFFLFFVCLFKFHPPPNHGEKKKTGVPISGHSSNMRATFSR